MAKPDRRTVDLSQFPDLVVVYLGYRASTPRGLLSLLRIGIGLKRIQATFPRGLLAHEFFMLGPFHVGFRQYWTDLGALHEFTHKGIHAAWWASFGKDTAGGGFWHEAYCRSGGMEALYISMPQIGFGRFAPLLDPLNSTTATRLGR
jgi:hypothetical protein